jgi:hypothetical protein
MAEIVPQQSAYFKAGPAPGSRLARATLANDWLTVRVAVDLAGFQPPGLLGVLVVNQAS